MTDNSAAQPDDHALDLLHARFPREMATAAETARKQAEALAAMPLAPSDAP